MMPFHSGKLSHRCNFHALQLWQQRRRASRWVSHSSRAKIAQNPFLRPLMTLSVKFTFIHLNIEKATEKKVSSCQWITIGVIILIIRRIIEVGYRDWVSDEVHWIRRCSTCIVGLPSSIREKPKGETAYFWTSSSSKLLGAIFRYFKLLSTTWKDSSLLKSI